MKVDQGTASQVVTSLEAILAELQELVAKALVAPVQLEARDADAGTCSRFNLKKLIQDGRVDRICANLNRYPVDFGIQLHALFASDRPTFEYFVRQRLIHRWLRAQWGGTKSFDHIYTTAFGQPISKVHVLELFSNSTLHSDITPITTSLESGDEVELDRIVAEAVFAVAQLKKHSTKQRLNTASTSKTINSTSTPTPTSVARPTSSRPAVSKVPIAKANVGGVAVTVPSVVQAAFTDHWQSIMVTPTDANPPNRAQRRAVARTIARRLTPVQREELDQPITADE
ncbi:hypothetical protein THRCLA_23165, partial [Thraustotheca clavata]